MGTGTIIVSPAAESIKPFTTRAGLSLKRSRRGRPSAAITLTTRLIMRASSALARPLISRLASQAGRGTGWPLNSPNATRMQKAPTIEAMPGSATGKSSGIASRLSHTMRWRLL